MKVVHFCCFYFVVQRFISNQSMNLNFAIPIFRHCTYFETKISNQAAELVVHCTRVVGVKSLGKMRGMTRLMDLLFFDKGRIDKKKSNTMHTRFTSRFVAAVRRAAAAAVRIAAAKDRRAAFADRFHHAPSTIAKECNYLQYDISQIRWSNDRG